MLLFLLLAVDAKDAAVRKHRTHKLQKHAAFFNASLCAFPGAEQAAADGSGADGTVAGAAVNTDIHKDGFWYVACKSDAMYTAGDKFGDGASRYEGGATAGTAIVRYDVIHDRESRKPMTPQVCFDFCRTVPDMQFFGLTNGRDCYCEHFYKSKTGDGVCDIPCDGDSGSTCGGKDMSSLYQMHSCVGGFEAKVTAFYTGVEAKVTESARLWNYADAAAADLQAAGDWLESLADSAASPLSQAAKAAAGPYAKLAAQYDADIEAFAAMDTEFNALDPFADDLGAEDRKASENMMRKMEAAADALAKKLSADRENVAQVHPGAMWAMKSGDADKAYYEDGLGASAKMDAELSAAVAEHSADAGAALATYEHIVKELGAVCGGELTGQPKVGVSSADNCALACDNEAPKSSDDYCVAFQYFADYDGVCFLFKKVESLTTYQCDDKKLFLQTTEPKSDDLPWCMVRHTDMGPEERKVVKALQELPHCFGD